MTQVRQRNCEYSTHLSIINSNNIHKGHFSMHT